MTGLGENVCWLQLMSELNVGSSFWGEMTSVGPSPSCLDVQLVFINQDEGIALIESWSDCDFQMLLMECLLP